MGQLASWTRTINSTCYYSSQIDSKCLNWLKCKILTTPDIQKNAPEFPGAFMRYFITVSVPVGGTFDGSRDLSNPKLSDLIFMRLPLNGPVDQRLTYRLPPLHSRDLILDLR